MPVRQLAALRQCSICTLAVTEYDTLYQQVLVLPLDRYFYAKLSLSQMAQLSKSTMQLQSRMESLSFGTIVQVNRRFAEAPSCMRYLVQDTVSMTIFMTS